MFLFMRRITMQQIGPFHTIRSLCFLPYIKHIVWRSGQYVWNIVQWTNQLSLWVIEIKKLKKGEYCTSADFIIPDIIVCVCLKQVSSTKQ